MLNPSLRQFLTVVVTAIATVPVLFLGFWVEKAAMERELAAVTDKHLLLAHNVTAALDRYANDAKATFEFLGGIAAAEDLPAGAARLARRTGIRHLFLIDEGGGVVHRLKAAEDAGRHLPAGAFQRLRPWTGDEAAFSDVMADGDGRPAIYLTRRVAPGRMAVGVLDLTYIREVQRSITFGRKGHSAVVDGRGNIIAHPRPDWQRQMKNLKKVKPVALMMAKETGITTFFAPAVNKDMVTGFTTVPGTGWGVMVPQPLEELEERAEDVRHIALGLIIIGLVVAALIGWYLSGLLVRTVNAVVRTAREFAVGDFDTRVPAQSGFAPKEFRDLGATFNSMAHDIETLITERQRADAELRAAHDQLEVRVEERTRDLMESEERYRTLVESANVIAWEMDPETWRFTYVSPRAVHLTGYRLEEWYAEDFWADHLHAEDRDQAVDYCKGATERGEDHDFEYRMVTADGGTLWLRDIITVVKEDGRPVLLRGFMIDITELKRTGEALQRSEERYKHFTADVAHELRTPLAVLRAHLESIGAGRSLQPLYEDIDTMSRLVSQLLAMTRLDSLAVGHDEEVDLHAIATNVAGYLAPIAIKDGRSIEVTGAQQAVMVPGNEDALEMAVRNLVENAIRYSARRSVVTIHVSEEPAISVSDRGQGIPSDQQRLIFQRFKRADRRSGGAGLGLSIVQRVVDAHRGTIDVSDAPGGGTTFKLAFPARGNGGGAAH